MRVDVYGLLFESQGLTCHLWSPWRCSQLEHRLFEAVKSLSDIEAESAPDELQLHITDAKTSKLAMQALARVLKGWQEEATDSGTERRSWRSCWTRAPKSRTTLPPQDAWPTYPSASNFPQCPARTGC